MTPVFFIFSPSSSFGAQHTRQTGTHRLRDEITRTRHFVQGGYLSFRPLQKRTTSGGNEGRTSEPHEKRLLSDFSSSLIRYFYLVFFFSFLPREDFKFLLLKRQEKIQWREPRLVKVAVVPEPPFPVFEGLVFFSRQNKRERKQKQKKNNLRLELGC